MKLNKKRAGIVVGGVGTAAALAALTLGGTSALFSSEVGPQQNSITAGTNVLTENGSASKVVDLQGFMPGDKSESKFGLKYLGNDSFVGFDVLVTSTAQKACTGLTDGPVSVAQMKAACTAPGTQPMFNGDKTSGSLDFTMLTVNANTYGPLLLTDDIQNVAACTATAGLVTCIARKDNVLIPPGYISAPIAKDMVWTNGQTDGVNIQSELPLAAPNVFQGSTVKIDILAEAVQYANNNTTKVLGGVSPDITTPYPAWQSTLELPKSWS
jgi:hypothetical protein